MTTIIIIITTIAVREYQYQYTESLPPDFLWETIEYYIITLINPDLLIKIQNFLTEWTYVRRTEGVTLQLRFIT